MLKEIVDETSHGRYDFMYLRIGNMHLLTASMKSRANPSLDFANNCKWVVRAAPVTSFVDKYSVGYAFINFEDVSPGFEAVTFADEANVLLALVHYGCSSSTRSQGSDS